MDEYIEEKSKVYIQIDEKNRIVRCDGGYTASNIKNIDEWIFIDEGTGDKYNLCQTHYFADGLYTDKGICKYKYEGNIIVLRSDEEMAEDISDNEEVVTNNATWEEMAEAIAEGVNDI